MYNSLYLPVEAVCHPRRSYGTGRRGGVEAEAEAEASYQVLQVRRTHRSEGY